MRSKNISIAILTGLLLQAPALHATPFKAGKHYITLDRSATATPELISFFSFYCFQCYRFEHKLKLPSAVESAFPNGVRFKKYHVSIGGPLGKDLSRAWAVAITLGVEQRVQPLLFDGIQNSGTIRSAADIRKLFIESGVPADSYDNALNSFAVNSILFQQKRALEGTKIYGVPAILINGKYQIRLDGVHIKDEAEFREKYMELVRFLLAKND